jgi:N-acetylneuraminate lyase
MQLKNLEGLIAAPFTPMDKDGSLNLGLVSRYYETLKLNRVAGAFICGSTGEGVSLTTKEKKQVIEAWSTVTEADKTFPVIVLVGGTSINESIELAEHAERSGLEAIAFTAPFYFKPADVKALAKVCMAVAESVPGLPFYYYHIPVLTGVDVPMIDLLKEIDGKLPNFAGIKYTHEDFMDFLTCLHFKNGKYDMLWGRDENMLPALAVGAKGSVGSTFNYAAPLYHDLISAFNAGNLEKAREKQQQAIDMIYLLGKYGGISTGKAYMKLIGLDCGEFRLPVKNMSAEQFDQFKKDVEKLNFQSFACQVPTGIKV